MITGQVIFLIVGIALVFAGANFLTDGTSALAKRMGISELAGGLTILAMATSLPEMFASFYSSARGLPDVAVGNIVGSNIFNTGLILGITAVIAPIAISKQNIRRDLPINLAAAILMLVLGMSATLLNIGTNRFTRVEGAVLVLLYAGYLYVLFKGNQLKNREIRGNMDVSENGETEQKNADGKRVKTWVSVLFIVLGVALLLAGAKLLVDSAVNIAKAKGVSEAFIAITIVAGGTSLPELVTCIVAAAKGQNQLALGNVIGSNISNIFLIIGGSALIRPLAAEGISGMDMGFTLLLPLILLLIPLIFKTEKIGRTEGVVLLLLFAGYIAWLLLHL